MASIQSDLVPSFPLDQALSTRRMILERLQAVRTELASLKHAAEVLGVDDIADVLGGGYRTDSFLLDKDGMQCITHQLDAKAWNRFMNLSGLRTFMDASSVEEWNRKIYSYPDQLPAFTHENVVATFTELHDKRWDLFDRGVVNCFKSLSWDYKTNNPCKFGSKVIIRGLVTHMGGSWWRPTSSVCDKLSDLCRVMDVLDGKPVRDHRVGLEAALQDAINRREQSAEDIYCNVKWFKNGNGHVTFTRPDLVEKLNAIVARYYPDALPVRG